MNPVERKEIEQRFKNFVGSSYLPRELYEERCNVDAEDCCGGKGNTCAPDHVPETWDDLIEKFADKTEYTCSQIESVVKSISDELENRVPA